MKMMKRTLCLVLALVMLVGMFTVGASAHGATTESSATMIVYGVKQEDNSVVEIAKFSVDVGNKISAAFDAEKPKFNVEDYELNYKNICAEKELLTTPAWNDIIKEGATIELYIPMTLVKEEVSTYTIKFDKNADDAYGSMDDFVVIISEETTLPAANFTRDGYTFIGWNTMYDGSGMPLSDKATIEAETRLGAPCATPILYAQWKANDEKPNAPTFDIPKGLLNKTVKDVIVVSCGDNHHDPISYSYKITAGSDVVIDETSGKVSVRLSNDEITKIAEQYTKDTGCKHTFVSRTTPGFTLEFKPYFPCWFEGYWKISAKAEMTLKCEHDHWCHDYCGGWFHMHTVTYTDGVKNATVFKDISYTVRHGEKTPVPATPVRAGYKFAGWTPAVATKTTKCVTYTATWVPAKTPALTKDHVAYLKGYGGGLVKPEGEITRAEAITMLYRLMDKASAKEFYTTYNAFTDVAKDAWYNDAVSTLANAGVLRYTTGLLNPNEKITRAEFFYMLTKFSNATYTGKTSFVDVPSNYWAYEELALAQYLGWIKGYGAGILNPDDTITRAEVAASLNRVLGRTTCTVKDTKNFTDNPVNAWYYDDIVEASIAH